MSSPKETVTLTRDVQAVMIPAGTPVTLAKGMELRLTQTLGGSYTVMGPGVMARVAGADADALGLAPAKADNAGAAAAHTGPVDTNQLWDAMKNCYDPEIPVNVVDLGLIYDCQVDPLPEGGHKVEVKMTLTAPGCGMGGVIAGDVEQRLREVPGVADVHVELVWDPVWNQSMMSDAARLQLGLM